MSQDMRPKSVYSSASYAKSEDWRVTLGSMQAVVLVGLITGCMFCAFTFGYVSGKKIGFETALDATMASAAKFPVSEPEEDMELSPEAVSSVYASLQADSEELAVVKNVTEITEPKAISTIKIQENEIEVEESPIEVVSVSQNAKTLTEQATESLEKKMEVISRKSEERVVSSIAKLADKKSVIQKETIKEATVVSIEDQGEAVLEVVNEKPTTPKVKEVEIKEPKIKEVKQDSSSSSIRSGWYAQVATSRDKSKLDSKARELKNNGFPVVVNTMSAGGVRYYRLLVGPEDSKDLGEQLKSQLMRESYITSRPFVRKY